jgi:ZIP family zinc transporter
VKEAVEPLLKMLMGTTFAGACIPLGAALARFERLGPEWLETEFRHGVIAFGGGVLFGAVALVLVPEGVSRMSGGALAVLCFLAGGSLCFVFERWQGRRIGRETPQLTAMLSDYLPESMALGGMFTAAAPGAMLLALLIGLQNLPEGFNAWRELRAAGPAPGVGRAALVFAGLVLLGPAAGLLGWFVLAEHPSVLGGLMLFSAGAILYLTFQDLAPQARLERHWGPPLGAVCGFSLALLGDLAIH